MEQITPKKSAEFWCNKCDANVVNSTDESTGKFFVQFGHQYDAKTGQYDGDYVGVMFALCKDCL